MNKVINIKNITPDLKDNPISSENGLTPYWNDLYQDKTSKLFSPSNININDLDYDLLNSTLDIQKMNSWFQIKWKPLQSENNSFQSLPSLLPEYTNTDLLRTKKFYLKPSKEQKILLKQWMGTYRWTYNKVVHTMEYNYNNNIELITYSKGRPVWYPLFCEEAKWLTEMPPNIIYEAMRKASHDYIQCIKLRSQGKPCNLPKCCYKTQRSFCVLGNTITHNGLYVGRMGKLKTSEPLPDNCKDSRVVREYNRWYLYIPMEVKRQQQTENQWRVGAIDPGVRTFATVFSELGVGKIGSGSFQRLVRLCHSLDKLLGEIPKSKHKKKRRLKQASNNMRRLVRNLVGDIHYQSLGWLFKKFDALIIPECNFTSAVRRITRRIRKKSVRSLLTWSFATFRDRAIYVGERLGKKVYIVNEAYTSKTANWTGEIVHNLGGRKVIKSGGLCMDRDINGALGIYLKALMGDPSLRQVA